MALRLMAVGMLAGLTACGATDEVNFIAGDNTMSFAQDETGRYTRTDASVLGDLSAVLPEGVVPVSGVRPAGGELAAAPTSTTRPSARACRRGSRTSPRRSLASTSRRTRRCAAGMAASTMKRTR